MYDGLGDLNMRNKIPFRQNDWVKTDDGWSITFDCPVVYHGDIPFLEVEAVQNETVTLNGKVLMDKKEGLFHIPLDQLMRAAGNELHITGDPAAVSILLVPKSHFYLHENGEPSLACMTRSVPDDGTILVNGTIKDPHEGDGLRYTLYAADGLVCDQVEVDASIQDPVSLYTGVPVLWNGVKDPEMYYISAQLIRRGCIQDEVGIPCGVRSFSVNEKGEFLLNDELYPLRIKVIDVRVDLAQLQIWKSEGITAIYNRCDRQDPAFLQLCDYLGLVVFEQIRHMDSQLNQGGSHPSLCFWVVSEEDAGELQALRMKDLTRLTVMEQDLTDQDGTLFIKMEF